MNATLPCPCGIELFFGYSGSARALFTDLRTALFCKRRAEALARQYAESFRESQKAFIC